MERRGAIGRLQGFVVSIEPTEERKVDDEGNEWRKCTFTVELTNFSKRLAGEQLPDKLRGVKVRVVRWCCFDWHCRIGVRITLTPEETEAVLYGTHDLTSCVSAAERAVEVASPVDS